MEKVIQLFEQAPTAVTTIGIMYRCSSIGIGVGQRGIRGQYIGGRKWMIDEGVQLWD